MRIAASPVTRNFFKRVVIDMAAMHDFDERVFGFILFRKIDNGQCPVGLQTRIAFLLDPKRHEVEPINGLPTA